MTEKIKIKYTLVVELEVDRSSYPLDMGDDRILQIEKEQAVDTLIYQLENNDEVNIDVKLV